MRTNKREQLGVFEEDERQRKKINQGLRINSESTFK